MIRELIEQAINSILIKDVDFYQILILYSDLMRDICAIKYSKYYESGTFGTVIYIKIQNLSIILNTNWTVFSSLESIHPKSIELADPNASDKIGSYVREVFDLMWTLRTNPRSQHER